MQAHSSRKGPQVDAGPSLSTGCSHLRTLWSIRTNNPHGSGCSQVPKLAKWDKTSGSGQICLNLG